MGFAYSVVIPTLNEEKRLGAVIEGILKVMKDVEIIVVDDSSDDSTVEIARKLGVKVISRSHRMGKGSAVVEGLKAANGEVIGFVDADRSIPENDILRVFEAAKGCLAIASRKHSGSVILSRQPLMRRAASRVYNSIVRLLFGLPFKDTQCGCKAMDRKVAERLIDLVSSKGFEFDVELLLAAKKKGVEIREIPVSWGHQEGSKFNLTKSPGMFFSLLRLRFK